ncbi:fibronectin type III domain-containing protein [Paenibacillus xanthanilyticus]|uniref:Fibronectin type III domain-containing protein n=1 Tax=Paenibacillus xanthanilyticus TaxID=1783531 RepID=A0ABV8K0Q0_9BACL
MPARKKMLAAISALTLLLPVVPAAPAFAATLNVTAYGANGGDTADDKAAIQSAVNAASAGDTVLIPAGTYYLSGSVSGKSGVKITGENRATTIIKFTSTGDNTMFSLYNVNDAEVSNMTLDGNSSTIAQSAVKSEGGTGNRMLDLNVKDLTASSGFGPFALYGIGSTHLRIAGNVITNTGVASDWGGGVRVGWGSSHALIENNTVHNTGRGGIFINDNSPWAIVRGNTVTGTGKKMEGLGIELHTDVDYSLVENNNVDHWISTVRSKYIAVRNNLVKATDGSVGNMGLEVMVDHGVTSGNLVDGGQQVGMQQSPGTGYQLWNYNTVQNIVMWGMQLQGAGTGQTEQYQYFYKNTWKNGPIGHPSAAYPGYDGNAVRIHGDTRNIVFDSNEIVNNGRKAIEITTASGTDRISFINNTITGNGGPSIDQYPSSAADLEWSGNTVSGNGTNTQLTSRGFADPKPVANFSAPLTVQLGQPVTFTNTSTDNGTIVENLWDLGEGIPVTDVSPTYTYQKAGTYKVILGVWDNGGRASVKEQTIVVSAGPPDTTPPSVPGNLTAPSKTDTSVTLSWTASTDNLGVAGYEIFRGATLAGTTTGSTTYTVTGLSPSTSYTFTVKAKDGSGNRSAASGAVSVTTNVSSANWVHCAGENNPCTFTGTKEVRYGANNSFYYGTYTNSVMCANNIFGDPAPGAYKTCDVNMGGASGGGSDAQAPSAPSGLTSPSKTDTSVALTWTASTDNVGVTGYEIYRGTTLAGTTSGATSYTATGLSPSTSYAFTVKAKDAAGNVSAASAALNVTTNATSGGQPGGPTPTGTITREYWLSISGATVASIPVGTTPSGVSALTSFEAPSNFGDNYGTRIRGYIVPTVTGTYQFAIAGDNNAELWLSANENAASKSKIAEVIDWTNEKDWNQYASQKSGLITLTAGQRYYVEVLHKEGGGGDHAAVAWKTPGSASFAVIGGANLAPIQ